MQRTRVHVLRCLFVAAIASASASISTHTSQVGVQGGASPGRPVKSAIVVGGGLAGLATALALSRVGISVRLLERARSYSPTAGAGFGFSPNGQLVLAALGVSKEEIRQVAHPITRIILCDGTKQIRVLTDNQNYAELEPKFGFPFGGSIRASLVDLLQRHLRRAGAKVLFGHTIAKVEEVGDDAKGNGEVVVTLENGRKMRADIVVGADGIGSTVAKCIFGGGGELKPLVYSHENIFYGVVRGERKDVAFRSPFLGLSNAMLLIFDKGEFITFRCGEANSKDKQDPLIWALTYRSSSPPDRAQWATDARVKDELYRVMSRLSPNHPVRELVNCTPAHCLTHFGMFFQEFKTKWHRGRVVLLGDAAHATLPYVGMGATQALEDAYVLAQCLQECGYQHEPSFGLFYERRAARSKKFVDLATSLGNLYHVENPILAWMRDRLMTFVLGSQTAFNVAKKEVLEECPVNYRDYLHI